ncbi:SIS domain-containing protein [Agrobacterium vitis]|uniref:SIS domain-containing protein n=1 Tax=Agrobacterium vitis TaxID=373 RepID=UPI0018D20021|nr:SIS domain-containing protein [Agrobacterium vitis]
MAEQLAPTIQQLEAAAEFGRQASSGIGQVLLVSAGAGLAIGRSLRCYTDEFGNSLRYREYASATFVDIVRVNSSMADNAGTLVLLSSKSGQTPETVEAAKFLKGKACKVVVFTASEDSPLASFGHPAFFLGETTQPFHATYMLMVSFLGGVWEMRENWNLLPALLTSLSELPTAVFLASEKGARSAEGFAERFKENHPLYFIASGCAGIVPHAFGLCVLQERFGFDIHAVDGADFFHSVVETVCPHTEAHYILIIPDDATRNQMLKVKTFLVEQFEEAGVSVEVIDTKEFDMPGIDPQVGKFIGPILAEAFLKPWAPALAKATKKSMDNPLLHMGKFAYHDCLRA